MMRESEDVRLTERSSIFVHLAEDQLQSTLRNAIKFVLKFVIDRYPSALSRLKPHSDELNLLLDLAIQWSYLHRWNASFTEHFFSLQRYNYRCGALNRKDIFNSLVIVTVVPYLMSKLDRYFDLVKERQQTNERFGQLLYELSRTEQALLQHYPIVKQLHQMVRIVLWLSYSTGAQHSPSLSLLLLGNLRIGYANARILEQRDSTGWWHSVSGKLTKLFDVTLKSGAFAVQFLEYWYSQADVRDMLSAVSESTKPPPPPKPKNLSTSPELCPLCLQKRANQTALSTSGYVFCYICIHDFVKNNGKCPITGFPCSLDQLIRIFD